MDPDMQKEVGVQGIPLFSTAGKRNTWKFRVEVYMKTSIVWGAVVKRFPAAASEVAMFKKKNNDKKISVGELNF